MRQSSCHLPRGAAIWLVSENRQIANACLETVKAFNAAWRAIEAGMPSRALLRQTEALSSAHNRLCERFNDRELVGQEVGALRETLEPDP
jgi:acetyl-CoA acetyltransferase